ncbi:hypothetical protein CU097_010602 [Rhizopus azygosporus]|uniref:Uncharacterized protein n=1 Tax=Rhizopus azygosporus TaxID=86630 RepID=A0A367JE78_RHIAZ|nr:hypothetical protein CU097_010602 [Rhizopus azygosporus]
MMGESTLPSLSEFMDTFGLIDVSASDKSIKHLCDNIFDVQRNELMEVLDNLKTVFWDEPTETTTITTTTTSRISSIPELPSVPETILPNVPVIAKTIDNNDNEPKPKTLKRAVSDESEPEELQSLTHKRPRLVSLPEPTDKKPTSDLWPMKLAILRQMLSGPYNETKLISLLSDAKYRQKR